MLKKLLPLTLLTGALAMAAFGLVNAQAPAEPQAYKPGLGDLMTMTVQPRHTKLGLAGQEKNWVYAAYEQHELQEAFDRAARVWPMYRKSDINALLASTMKEPMEAVSEAIKNADVGAFNDAYARLTDTCNACHQATERSFVVIRVPRASPFPDQDFRPVKP
jgi:cytochrome c556